MPVFSLVSRWLALLLVLGATPALAQEDTSPYSDAALVSDRAAVRPGETFDVALRITMDPGWHNYWINPGDAGMPTHIAWELPEGVTAGKIRWPYPQWIEVPPFASYAYKDEVLLLTEITVPEGFPVPTLDLRAEHADVDPVVHRDFLLLALPAVVVTAVFFVILFGIEQAPGDDTPGVAKLHKLYVLPEHHGSGYGMALIDDIRNRLLKSGIYILDLNVNRYNPARGFYEKAGFRVLREEDVPIGPYWMNDFVMRLTLR